MCTVYSHSALFCVATVSLRLCVLPVTQHRTLRPAGTHRPPRAPPIPTETGRLLRAAPTAATNGAEQVRTHHTVAPRRNAHHHVQRQIRSLFHTRVPTARRLQPQVVVANGVARLKQSEQGIYHNGND